MNPYLSNEVANELQGIKDKIESNNNKARELAGEKNTLLGRIRSLRNKCNHTDSNGKSTWEYTGQDPGSGRSEHSCSICGTGD